MPKKKGQDPPVNRKKRVPNTDKLELQQQQQQLFVSASVDIKRTKALQILGGNQMPQKFKFRDQQISSINKYIQNCLNKKIKSKYRILMITGSPGAGKTLSINYVMSKLNPQIQVIRFNANIIKTVKDVQHIICVKLLDMAHGANMSTIQIIRHLQQNKVKKKFLIYIEQIQIILQQKTNIFTEDFFTLFSNQKLNIMLLGVSNTIDSIAAYSKNIAVDLKEIKNIVFEPYTRDHIVEIMKQKIKQIHRKTGFNIIISQKFLLFIANKLQQLKKGDIRIVLQYLKILAGLVLPQSIKQCHSAQQQGYVVNISNLQKAFSSLRVSKSQILSTLPRNQQLTILALYLLTKRNDSLFTLKKDLFKQATKLFNLLNIQAKGNILEDTIEQIQQYSLIMRQQTKKVTGDERITLKVSLSEIQAAFEDHMFYGKFFDEFKKE